MIEYLWASLTFLSVCYAVAVLVSFSLQQDKETQEKTDNEQEETDSRQAFRDEYGDGPYP